MVDERWYDDLHKGYDKEHRARDIENNGVRLNLFEFLVITCQFC